jgi:hypothetical protein
MDKSINLSFTKGFNRKTSLQLADKLRQELKKYSPPNVSLINNLLVDFAQQAYLVGHFNGFRLGELTAQRGSIVQSVDKPLPTKASSGSDDVPNGKFVMAVKKFVNRMGIV